MSVIMEGPKRLQFTTLEPPSKEEKKKPAPPTVRFELSLPESTDSTCPEFFYSELMKTAPGADLNKSTASDGPFGNDDDPEKLAAIARAFEAKYNKPGEGKKKKKKWKHDYFMDLGDGYDETDTFIDNSEAYDEIVPEQLTTKLGGFYINAGRLDLRVVSDDSEDDFMSPPTSKENKKKRRIESEDESEEEKKPVKKKKIKDGQTVDGEIKKKKKKKLSVPDGEKAFKKPKRPQDKEKSKQNKSSSMAALIKSTSPNINGEKHETNGVDSPDSDSDSNEEKSQVRTNISLAIDSVIARVTKEDSNSSIGEFQEKKDVDPESIPKLPSNLPPGVEEKLDELKKLAKESQEGKCKFFTTHVNKLLLGVELASKQMTVGSRSCMYGHLAAFLPCSKETLLKRAKTLRVKEMEDKIKEPMEKLQQAVSRVMPALLEKYEADCKKATQEKQEENAKESEKDGGKEDGGSESDDDEKSVSNADSVTKKRQMGPRKKFVWDNNLRSLLCDVVRVKMHSYQMAKSRSQTAEEYCKEFLDTDVRPLWPKGWMQTRALYKESKSAHSLWTNPQKPKKNMLINKTPNQSPAASKPQTANSAPTLVSMPKVNATGAITISPSPPSATSVKQDNQSNPVTPVGAHVKKLTPTILYSKSDSLFSHGSNSLTSLSQNSSNSLLMQHAKSAASPVVTISQSQLSKVLEARAAASMASGSGGLKSTEQSWDHMVSDILRSSLGEQPVITNSPKSAADHKQATTAADSYMAQYEKYALAGTALATSNLTINTSPVVQSASVKKSSPPQVVQKQSAMNLSLPQQQKQHQRLLHQQQQQQLAKLEKEEQLKQLQKQKKILQQYEQNIARHRAEMSANAQCQSAQKPMVVSPPQSKLSLPSQSPMSLAMSKSIPQNQTTAKKLSNQFSPQAAKTVSYMTENIVRQQLSNSSAQNATLTQAKLAQQNASKSLPYVTAGKPSNDLMYGQVFSTSAEGQQKKTSPKSQGLTNSHHSTSPGITIVGVQSAQKSSPVASTASYNTSSSMASNGKPAVSLLKTLFNQAQSQGPIGQYSGNQPLSLLSTGSPTNLSTSLPQWSPNSMKSSPTERSAFSGLGDGPHGKPFPMTTSPRQLPGYQGLKLTNEQLASFQAGQRVMQRQVQDNTK